MARLEAVTTRCVKTVFRATFKTVVLTVVRTTVIKARLEAAIALTFRAATKLVAAAKATTTTAAAELAAAFAVIVTATATLFEALSGFHAGNHFSGELLACVGFDVKNFALVTELGQGHSQAITTCTTGAANAVRVVLRLHGQAKVEHVRDGGHVNAASSHVSSHQELHLPLAQSHQAAVTQALAQRTMQGYRRETFLLQVIGQAVALDLGAGKDDGLVDGGVTQEVIQQTALVLCVVRPMQDLTNVAVFFLWRIDLHALGLTHHAGGQLLNARRKGGAEHHGLLAVDGELVDLSQVIGKAQVEHAVGFVHDQELNFVQLDLHGAL